MHTFERFLRVFWSCSWWLTSFLDPTLLLLHVHSSASSFLCNETDNRRIRLTSPRHQASLKLLQQDPFISPERDSFRPIPTQTMCQLLGMNCATPTDFSFSFRGFCQRGGSTDIHSHGWGLAIYEGRGLRTFLDTEPASTSPVAELVSRYPIKTFNMMAHVRYATQGEVSLENVHPFSRELVRL